MKSLLCFLFGLLVTKTIFAEIPAEIKKCKAGDNVCIAKAITYVLNKYPQGNKALGLSELEPLRADNVVLSEGNEGALSLKFFLKDMKVFGISNGTIISTKGFTAEPGKFELVATAPSLNMKGKYNIGGRLLVLPIQGDGDIDLTLENVKIPIKLNPEVIKKDGLTYLKLNINRVKALMEPERLSINLGNLFNGDKALGDNMNMFMNENWKEIWGEMSGGISSAIGKILESVFTNAFEKLPYEEWYEKE